MNQILLKLFCTLLIITGCNSVGNEKKIEKSSSVTNTNDISEKNDAKEDQIITNNDGSKKIFSIKDDEIYINCDYINENNLNTSKKIFDIELIKKDNLKNRISIDESLSDYFSKILDSPNAKSFYYSSSDFFPCSAIIYVKHEMETTSLYLFQFDKEGKFINKFTLSEEILMPGAISKKISEIKNNEPLSLKVTFTETMIDEYTDENNFSEIIDSIVSSYSFEKGKLQLKSKDSTRHKIEVKQ